MMRLASTVCLLALIAAMAGCSTSADQPRDPVDTAASEEELEIIAGLKEAMVVGTNRAVDRLAQEDGYYGDPAVRVPLPDDAQQISGLLRDADLGYLIDDLELAMNRAAEYAAAEAADVLVPAAEDMIVVRSRNLLDGRDTAVTQYFRQRTANQVDSAYEPIIRFYLEAEAGYQQWVRQIPEKRRELPSLNLVAIDLAPHVNTKALDGFFTAIGDEERAIRTQPEMRTSDLLQTVFGGR